MRKKNKRLPLEIVLPAVILGAAAFLRFFRLNELLGFWYDQGRDALIIWDLIHSHKFFLIGPTTGLSGVFRGPWYYWLITPFYFLGKGNPVWPSAFLTSTTIAAIYIVYKVAKKWFGDFTAIIFVLISSFSSALFSSARWLSNPTPMFLISALYLLGISKIAEGKKWGWYLIFGMSGLSMQFGSAAEVFYIPGIVILLLIFRRHLPSFKEFLISILLFTVSFVPQIIFEVRHSFVITKALYENLFGTSTQAASSTGSFLISRCKFYFDLISTKIFLSQEVLSVIFWILGVIFLILNFKKTSNGQPMVKAILAFTSLPFVGLLFFKGNHGVLYDYYFTGYYLFVVLVFSLALVSIKPIVFRNLLIVIFVPLFLFFNLREIAKNLSTDIYRNGVITLGIQKKAIDWIYEDAGEEKFNVDAYVPPIIPYAYDYLFKWLGTTKYNELPEVENVPLLYTLEEVDTEHPDRIRSWYHRQSGIGRIKEFETFGLITVERRIRNEE